ncbi:putative serine--tRNA ligase DIA4 [Aspergillus saccharolyticus JOP 1030-1]|uniref:serine--tRNA ligase n=1 Tax=Aspergillus saccharolyticus JOP 1030-1 TaxID=1450539 RepID=A0A318ZEK6_9EURO|nr:seryl-tRNA synthetase [Aspergillus saccharolyticus JOP 1030-1]PYH45545.1 seryl-tRNA synthetase [Aspergillus saccharolyticus JOP 1030-1]
MAPPRSPYVCLGCRLLSRRSLTTSARRLQVVRPPTAPKPTPDVKHIRKHPELYAQNCRDRNYPAHAQHPFTIQQLYDEIGEIDVQLRAPRTQIKKLERAIAEIAAGQAKNQYDGTTTTTTTSTAAQLRAEAAQLRSDAMARTTRQQTCDEEMQRLALSLPNLSSPDTPIGDTPTLISYLNFDPSSPLPDWATKPDPTRSHVHIGNTLGLLDFTSSATTTGWGWYFLTNEGALLEQALIQYALTVARRHGWKPVSPPSIVYSHIADACGFQPRDQHNEQQIFTLEQPDKDSGGTKKPQRALAGTAEIPLAAMHAGRTFDPADLPLKLVGPSRCYRAEAGSRGVDTKGLYRVHEFTKVEMFAWADSLAEEESASSSSSSSSPMSSTSSNDLFDELLKIQSEILQSLGLPARILEMPTFDLGASASRKRDIEVLFPSRLRTTPPATTPAAAVDTLESAWGEVTSASICTDYQSRRLATRVKPKKGKGATRFAHTVNGTAMAVPRVLAALLEHGWDPKREVVVVPEVLRGWMGGLEVIGKQK